MQIWKRNAATVGVSRRDALKLYFSSPMRSGETTLSSQLAKAHGWMGLLLHSDMFLIYYSTFYVLVFSSSVFGAKLSESYVTIVRARKQCLIESRWTSDALFRLWISRRSNLTWSAKPFDSSPGGKVVAKVCLSSFESLHEIKFVGDQSIRLRLQEQTQSTDWSSRSTELEP